MIGFNDIDNEIEEGDLVDKVKSTEKNFKNPDPENQDYKNFKKDINDYKDFN